MLSFNLFDIRFFKKENVRQAVKYLMATADAIEKRVNMPESRTIETMNTPKTYELMKIFGMISRTQTAYDFKKYIGKNLYVELTIALNKMVRLDISKYQEFAKFSYMFRVIYRSLIRSKKHYTIHQLSLDNGLITGLLQNKGLLPVCNDVMKTVTDGYNFLVNYPVVDLLNQNVSHYDIDVGVLNTDNVDKYTAILKHEQPRCFVFFLHHFQSHIGDLLALSKKLATAGFAVDYYSIMTINPGLPIHSEYMTYVGINKKEESSKHIKYLISHISDYFDNDSVSQPMGIKHFSSSKSLQREIKNKDNGEEVYYYYNLMDKKKELTTDIFPNDFHFNNVKNLGISCYEPTMPIGSNTSCLKIDGSPYHGDDLEDVINSPELYHPYQDRIITIKELGKILTYPVNYMFFGSYQYVRQMLTTSYPPMLGKAIGQGLIKYVLSK